MGQQQGARNPPQLFGMMSTQSLECAREGLEHIWVARWWEGLEREADREQKRLGIVAQDQGSRAKDNHLPHSGQEELKEELTRHTYDMS